MQYLSRLSVLNNLFGVVVIKTRRRLSLDAKRQRLRERQIAMNVPLTSSQMLPTGRLWRHLVLPSVHRPVVINIGREVSLLQLWATSEKDMRIRVCRLSKFLLWTLHVIEWHSYIRLYRGQGFSGITIRSRASEGNPDRDGKPDVTSSIEPHYRACPCRLLPIATACMGCGGGVFIQFFFIITHYRNLYLYFSTQRGITPRQGRDPAQAQTRRGRGTILRW